jgi:DNA-binding NtrC family response regulator
MLALVLVAHDDTPTRERAVAALNAAGITAVGFRDPMAALDAIEAAPQIRVLVTRVDFGVGKLNGVALTRMVKVKRPGIQVSLSPSRRTASTPREWGSSCRCRLILTCWSTRSAAC